MKKIKFNFLLPLNSKHVLQFTKTNEKYTGKESLKLILKKPNTVKCEVRNQGLVQTDDEEVENTCKSNCNAMAA